MAEHIKIEKENIPYSFDIMLSDKTYTFNINYSLVSDRFTVDLLLEGKLLAAGEKIVYGVPLFEQIRDTSFFDEIIVPYDLSKQQTEVNFSNLGETVFLWILPRQQVL